MLLVVGLLLLALTGGGGAAAYLLGLWPGAESGSAHAAGSVEAKPVPAPRKVTFVDLPDLLVNLRASDRRPRFLKLRLALEVGDEQVGETVRSLTPRVMDSFQLYLRSLGEHELDGPRGLQMLKDEMLARINHALAPARVDDVLVKEMLIQ